MKKEADDFVKLIQEREFDESDLRKEVGYLVDKVQKIMIHRFTKVKDKIQDQFIIALAREIK